MPGSTVNRGYPYPLPGDPTNPPGDIEALARAVDDDVAANLVPATAGRIIGHIRAGQTQNIVKNTETQLRFHIEYQDTDDMADTVASPTAMTVNTSGLYSFWGMLAVPTNATWTTVILRFRVNGTEIYSASQNFQSASQTFFNWSISTIFPCVVGDVLTMTFVHNSASDMVLGTTREFFATRMAT